MGFILCIWELVAKVLWNCADSYQFCEEKLDDEKSEEFSSPKKKKQEKEKKREKRKSKSKKRRKRSEKKKRGNTWGLADNLFGKSWYLY